MPAKKTTKSWRRKLLFLCAGTVLGFGLCEALLRVTKTSYPVFDNYDAVRGFALRPGKEGWYEKEGHGYIQVNSLGYRDEEHEFEKPDDVYRIVFLGDSFTEARQVALEDTFWKQIERNLNADPRMAGRRVQAISCAAGGYSTTQELLTLGLHGLAFDPDLVLLAMYLGNDVTGNSKRLSKRQGLSTFQPFHVYKGSKLVLDNSFRDLNLENLRQRFILTAIHYSRLLEVINQLRRERHVEKIKQVSEQIGFRVGVSRDIYSPPRNYAWKEAWLITQDVLLMMRDEVGQAGGRFLVASLSTEEQVHPDPERRRELAHALYEEDLFYSERRLRAFGAENDFEVVTLAERMQAAAEESAVYFHGFENTAMGYGHWNLAAHTLAAQILTEEILRRGLAP